MPREIQGMNTQNNPERTNRESKALVPPGLTWQTVEDVLLRQEPFPAKLPADILAAQCASGAKYLRTNRAAVRAIAPEYLQAFIDSVFREVADEEPVTGSIVTPFAPRGQVVVPTDPNVPATVLSFIVPNGYQFWIGSYAFDLFPDTTNELNYAWRLFVNGQDILNKSQRNLVFGRPVKNNRQVILGNDKATQILAQPGDEISVVVIAASALPASDYVSATVFGNLEPAP